MKTKLICWLPTVSYNPLEEYGMKTVHLLIENKIVPLLDSSYSQGIWKDLGKPDTLRYITYGTLTNLQPYIDEPITNKMWRTRDDIILGCPKNMIVGETSTETIQQLVDAGCKNITYTAYGWHLFRIAGVNIRMPFTSQLNTWKYLENKYNWQVLYSDKSKQYFSAILPKEEHKFTFTWIMLDQQRHWRKLITWATQHNKTIGIVAPDSKQQDVEWIYKQLTKFMEAYKEVIE